MGRGGVIYRETGHVASAAFAGCHELVWLSPETPAYTRSGDREKNHTLFFIEALFF